MRPLRIIAKAMADEYKIESPIFKKPGPGKKYF